MTKTNKDENTKQKHGSSTLLVKINSRIEEINTDIGVINNKIKRSGKERKQHYKQRESRGWYN